MMEAMELLARKRAEALWQFLEDHMDLFGVNTAIEDVELTGPEMVTGALLIIRSRDTGGEGELFMSTCAPYSLGLSEKLGMVERQRNYYRDDS